MIIMNKYVMLTMLISNYKWINKLKTMNISESFLCRVIKHKGSLLKPIRLKFIDF